LLAFAKGQGVHNQKWAGWAACVFDAKSQILPISLFGAIVLLIGAARETRMTQRKVVTKPPASTESSTSGKAIPAPHDLVVHRALVPVAPADDVIPQDVQREKKLGPDFNPDYFDTVDALIEQTYGPATGKFRPVSGD
jgi:hypothetical protein